jgi:hypothetical protein
MRIHHFRALARFWWLLAIGLSVAMIVAVEMVAKVSVSLPPKVTYRSQPTYSARQLELVTNLNNPYLRTQETTVVPRPPRTQTVETRGRPATVQTVPQAPTVEVQAPDVNVLVRAANYYPYLIQSDPVVVIRNRRFGPLPGEVTARALNSFQTPSRFRESIFPIVEVIGTARGPRQAVQLTRATVIAFREWLTKSQNQARVPKKERVLIQDLQRADEAVASGGPKHGLDILVGVVVFAAFAVLALVLDKVVPRGRSGFAVASGPAELVIADGARQATKLARDRQPSPNLVAHGSDESTPPNLAHERSKTRRLKA